MPRGIALCLVLLAAGSLAACAPSTDEPAPWRATRPVQPLPQDPSLRWSRDNVSRPGGRTQDWRPVALGGAEGAWAEFEVAPLTGDEAPRAVTLRWELDGETGELPATRTDTGDDKGWYSYRVDLAGVVTGPVDLRVAVDGELWPPEDPDQGPEHWFVAAPRLYQERDRADRFNVLLITVDTLRADVLGCYGHDRDTSPSLDRLAAQSVFFERAVAQSSWTLPSYVSLFTALYPESHGVVHRRHRLDGRFVTLAERMAEAGYTTGAFVTGTFTDADWGFDQGFDLYDDFGMVTDDRVPPEQRPQDVTDDLVMQAAEQRITSPEVTDRAISWLEQTRDRRFFLMAHYFDPHGELQRHPGVSERFPPRPHGRRLLLVDQPVPEDLDQQFALYEGEVAFTDQHIGRLLEYLEQSGLAGNTIVVLCADHGDEYFERARQGHGHALFQELVHVPLMIRVPGVEPARVAAPVANVDLFPTLAELCGLPHAFESLGGESLVPLFQDPGAQRGAPVLSVRFPTAVPEGVDQAPWDWFRVDQGEYSFLYWRRGQRAVELLFKSAEDPLHRNDLRRSHGSQAERMRALYQQLSPRLQEIRQRIGTIPDVKDFDLKLRALEGLGYTGDSDLPPGGDDGGP